MKWGEVDTTPSDLYLKSMGRWKPERAGDVTGSHYEEAILCIKDKETEYEITGGLSVDGRWTVKRVL
jgi:hypothetical protein